MNRCGFLGLFGGAVAALTLDPEKELWVPGKKLISIPALPRIFDPSKAILAAVAAITEQQQFIINSFGGQIYDIDAILARLVLCGDPIYDEYEELEAA